MAIFELPILGKKVEVLVEHKSLRQPEDAERSRRGIGKKEV